MANLLVKIITTYFPDSTDELPEDQGEVSGPKPLIFKGVTEDQMQLSDWIFGDMAGGSVEFGANQVILVRNEQGECMLLPMGSILMPPEARERLEKKIGNIGLILTIFESKGLEMQDVLIYRRFFCSY
jgi:hypothetical protein